MISETLYKPGLRVGGWEEKASLPVQEYAFSLALDLPETERWLESQSEISFEKIKLGDNRKQFSDAWFDLMMNFYIERTAIERCKQNFITSEESSEGQLDFDDLLNRWLWSEFIFAAAEFGCEKHLHMQPKYSFLVGNVENQIWMSPADLRRFGDQAKRYEEVNERVGNGLYWVYSAMVQGGEETAAAVVSVTEEYQKYFSTYDVINLMKVVGTDIEGYSAEGMYLILSRVLSQIERRFVHNLFYLVNTSGLNLRDLAVMTKDELGELVSTDTLWVSSELGEEHGENHQLVMRPNLFQGHGLQLEDMALLLNQIFFTRFDKPLLDERDQKMYPLLQALTSKYFDTLKYYLWENPDKDQYQRWFRVMLYECQYYWKQQDLEEKQVPFDERDFLIREHMWALAEGMMIVGFEMSGTFENEGDWTFSNSWDQPLGYEEMNGKYCRKHKQMYEGSECPKCRQYSKKNSD